MRITARILASTSLIVATLPLALAAPGTALALSKERLAQYAALPDWSGVWKLKGTAALLDQTDAPIFAPGNADHAPYKPEWEALYRANRKRAEDQGNQGSANPIVDTHTVYCFAGMPRDIATPFEYQFSLSPEEVMIQVGGEIRDIFTDGRKRPDDDTIWDKYWGWSLGHWEGDTLVVETTHAQADLWVDTTPMTLSNQAVIHERIHRVDANTIQDDVRIEDPVRLTRPWTFTRQYVKTNGWPDEKEVCGGKDDRNPIIDGRVTVKLK